MIAFLSLVFFKGTQDIPTRVFSEDITSHLTENAHQLSEQPPPKNALREISGSHLQKTELQTELYDLEGNLLGAFPGKFQETTPDNQYVITYVPIEERSYVSQLDGTEPKALAGIFQDFSPSDQQIITYHQNQSHLYELDGTLIASLDGLLKWGTFDGRYLVTDAEDGQTFNLYSADGTLQAVYKGNFRGFALHTPQLIKTEQMCTYLYNFDGTLASSFKGEFQDLSPDGESLVTLTYQPVPPTNESTSQLMSSTSQSHLYDLDGTLRSSMTGEFAAFTPIGLNVITDSQSPPRSWLYGPNGVQQSTFEGIFLSFTPNGQGFLTYGNGASHLYYLNSNGNNDDQNNSGSDTSSASQEQAHFLGALLGMTTDAQRLVTANLSRSRTSSQSWLYSTDGTKLATLEGIFIGFISDEQRIVTSKAGSEGFFGLASATYFIYDLAGNLKATLTGQLLGLTQGGHQGLVMYADGKTRPYDSFEGSEQAVFEGKVLGFTRDEAGVFMDVEG